MWAKVTKQELKDIQQIKSFDDGYLVPYRWTEKYVRHLIKIIKGKENK